MVSQDLSFRVYQLEKRIDSLDRAIDRLGGKKNLDEQDWDDATLQRRWNVCKRTAANYRKNGLEYLYNGSNEHFKKKKRKN